MEDLFTLISGRTKKQAAGLHKGPGSVEHIAATTFVEISGADMTRLGVTEGQTVRLVSAAGSVELPAFKADLPSGLLFMPMGPAANTLVETETFGVGMPSFKGQQVKVEPV
jgi:formylmethanofuran dehydrogenase subunit D